MTEDVRCPACGSNQLREIALGQYECLGQVPARKSLPSSLQGVAEPPPEYRACGERFAVGPVPTCYFESCERKAQRECAVCGQPACHEHGGTKSGEPFLCRRCSLQIADEKRDAQLEAQRRKHEEAVLWPVLELEHAQEIADHLIANLNSFRYGDATTVWSHLMALRQAPATHDLLEIVGAPSFRRPARGVWGETGTRSDLWVAPEAFTDPRSRRTPPLKQPGAFDVEGNFMALEAPCILRKPVKEAQKSIVLPKGQRAKFRRHTEWYDKVWLVRNGYSVKGTAHASHEQTLLAIAAIAKGSGGT